jgi:tetratricopeptide (TPR) repeat protein
MNLMQDVQPGLIEKYQILLERDPKSQVFAPLAEAYRRMGMIEEAFRIAVRGVQFNPNFGGGRIALAKIFLDRDNLPGAITELEKAVEFSADNIMAHSLLGECRLKNKQPKEALRSFKMVLFLMPNNEKAQKAVKKLEALTADEYEDDLFEMKPLSGTPKVEAAPLKPLKAGEASADLDRVLSLVDAFIVRNDMNKAYDILKENEASYGAHPEIIKRFKLINQRGFDAESDDSDSEVALDPPPSREATALDGKIDFLRGLLKRLEEYSQFTAPDSSIIRK